MILLSWKYVMCEHSQVIVISRGQINTYLRGPRGSGVRKYGK